MDNILEQFFNRNFGNQTDSPNPFDGNAFADFISDQIKNAMPQNANGLQNGGREHNYPAGNPFGHQQVGDRPHASSPQAAHTDKNHIRYNVFEMHDYVIVRIALSNLDSESKKKILVNSYELLLKEKGRENPILSITLPKPVFSRKSKLSMQNGILEVQMMKKTPEEYDEFEIGEIFKSES